MPLSICDRKILSRCGGVRASVSAPTRTLFLTPPVRVHRVAPVCTENGLLSLRLWNKFVPQPLPRQLRDPHAPRSAHVCPTHPSTAPTHQIAQKTRPTLPPQQTLSAPLLRRGWVGRITCFDLHSLQRKVMCGVSRRADHHVTHRKQVMNLRQMFRFTLVPTGSSSTHI